ncbi:MAG: hypothetical protein ABSB32_11135 [Thermodesulfobacteriota bacterium]
MTGRSGRDRRPLVAGHLDTPVQTEAHPFPGEQPTLAAGINLRGGTIQDSFDVELAQLNTEIGKAVYRLANAGANPPTGTTIVIVYGRSPTISINGAAAVTIKTYLTSAIPATAGYHPDIAKANWNYSLVSLDSSKGIHNPSFTFAVLDATIAKMKTL